MIKKLCLLVLLCLMFIPVVYAESATYTDIFAITGETFVNAFTGYGDIPVGSNTALNMSVERIENTSGLQLVSGNGYLINEATHLSYTGSHSVPVTVYAGAYLIGDGTLTLDFLGGVFPTQLYLISFIPTNWNATAAPAGNYFLRMVYDKAVIHDLVCYGVSNNPIIIPSTTSGLYFSTKSAGVVALSSTSGDVNVYTVNFKNIISVQKDLTTSKITYQITKVTGAPYTGTSKVTLITGSSVILDNITGSSDISSYTYSAPISILVKELLIGRNMQYTYFDNTYNLSSSALTTTQNLPVVSTLRSSSGSFPTASAVSYSWNNPITNTGEIFKENFAATNRTLDYILKGSNWYGWDSYFGDYTYNKGLTMPTAVNMYFPTSGRFNTSAVFYRPAFGYTLVNGDNINVTGGINAGQTTILAVNGNTGGIISSATISVKDLTLNQWINVSGNPVVFPSSTNGYANVYATASLYYPASSLGIKLGEQHTIAMYPVTATSDPVNLTTLNVLVVAGATGDIPVKDAYVSITLSNLTVKSDYTNTAGSVSFIVNNNSVITSTAEKTGYPKTSSVNTVTGGNYLVVLRLLTTTIPTPPPITTVPVITAIPTLIGGQIRNLTPAVCGAPTSGMNIVQIFKQNIACWGVEDRISQDLVFAAIIIAFFAFVLSKWGKGLGALIGASIGFILSLAAGLIPVWVFFALVIIAGLIFGLKLYGGGK